ncbi:hydrolase [Actinomadura rubrobrunea]|uniref:Hydrolase n=1 Tax=Actinomadura rubrobrunea TaxID=115335 RepID=A0A9W6PQJ1_9ACTN|nr:alpha/beta hydrolase [Actinomadura rubrobrunea]GLW62665.1 hydrolase [Actinomadura rubrobrunea]
MPFAELGEVRLFYTDDGPSGGDRAPLLLVHGYGADSHDWVPHLPRLTAEHRVIAPDLRGHGHSSAPESGYRPRDMAADLVRLLDRLDVPRVTAVGHSMGALVVSALAVEQPDRVRALVCVDPGYGQPPEIAAGFPAIVERLRADPYGTALANDAWCYTAASPPWLREHHRRKILATSPRALVEAFAGMYSGDDQFGARPAADAYLARRACPVLSCWSHAQAGSAEWERGLFKHPASRALVWPGGGHRLHAERPEEFLLVVTGWLAGLERPDPLDKEMPA